MSIVLTALFLCTVYNVEATLHVYLEDMSMEEVNPEYFDVDNTVGFILDNMVTTNLTIVKSLPEDSEAHFRLSGLSMGKYTLPTGVDLSMSLCEVPDEPIILGPFFTGLGILANGCPPPPGVYIKEGYNLPMENLPDDFPNNKYQVVFEMVYGDDVLLSSEIFVDIQS